MLKSGVGKFISRVSVYNLTTLDFVPSGFILKLKTKILTLKLFKNELENSKNQVNSEFNFQNKK